MALAELARAASAGDRPGARSPAARLRRPGHRLGGHRPVAGRRGGGPRAAGSRCGPPTSRPTPWTWPGPTVDELAGARPGGRRPGAGCAEGPWFDALPDRLAGGSTWWCPTRPTWPRPSIAGLDPTVRDWEPRGGAGGGPGRGGVAGHGRHRGGRRRRRLVAAAGAAAWWSSSLRPRPTRPSTPPGGPASRRSGTERDLAGRLADAGGRAMTRVAPGASGPGAVRRGGRGPGRRGGGGRAHRHRLRPGRRPGPARGGGPALRAQGPAGRRAAARAGRRARAGGAWWPAASEPAARHLADRYWPGPLTLVVPAGAGLHRRPRRPARRPARRSGCAGPTIRWCGPSASCSARWPSPAPTSTGPRRPPRPTEVARGLRRVRSEPGRRPRRGHVRRGPVDGGRVPGPGVPVPARGGPGLGRPARPRRTPGPGTSGRRRGRGGVDGAGPDGGHWGMQHVESLRDASTVIIID